MVKGTGTNPTLNIVPSTSATPSLRVNDNSNVGLGTATPESKLTLESGDVYLKDAANGIILTNPVGDCYRVTVGMTGNLITTSITCPN